LTLRKRFLFDWFRIQPNIFTFDSESEGALMKRCVVDFHQKVKTTGFSRSALAAPIGPLGIITEVGKVWFSSLARGAKWVGFSLLRLARTHQL
jgi:hypothetical protein